MSGLLRSRALLAVVLLLAVEPGRGQTGEQGDSQVTFRLMAPSQVGPVKLEHVFLDGKEIPLNTPVPVQGMWLRSFRMVLVNTSPKTIVRYDTDLIFPEVNAVSKGPVPALVMSRGNFPRHAFLRRDGTYKEVDTSNFPGIEVAPNAEFVVAAHEDADAVQSRAYAIAGEITTVYLSMNTFYFADESKWLAGRYYLPVPQPVVWQEVSPAEFDAGARAGGQ
jgi:hypothetical protein